MTLSSTSNSLMKLAIVALAMPFGIRRSEGLHLKSRGLIKSLRNKLLNGRGSSDIQAPHLQTTTMKGAEKVGEQNVVLEDVEKQKQKVMNLHEQKWRSYIKSIFTAPQQHDELEFASEGENPSPYQFIRAFQRLPEDGQDGQHSILKILSMISYIYGFDLTSVPTETDFLAEGNIWSIGNNGHSNSREGSTGDGLHMQFHGSKSAATNTIPFAENEECAYETLKQTFIGKYGALLKEANHPALNLGKILVVTELGLALGQKMLLAEDDRSGSLTLSEKIGLNMIVGREVRSALIE